VQIQLVGFSVLETACKLKATRNDGLYDAFVREFLGDTAGRTTAGSRNARIRFYIDCEVLGMRQQFDKLLSKVQRVCATPCHVSIHLFVNSETHLPSVISIALQFLVCLELWSNAKVFV
jgi:hypothetical protein